MQAYNNFQCFSNNNSYNSYMDFCLVSIMSLNIWQQIVSKGYNKHLKIVENEDGSVKEFKCICSTSTQHIPCISQTNWLLKRHINSDQHKKKCGWYLNQKMKIQDYYRKYT